MRAVWLTTNYGLDWPKTKAKNENGRISQQREITQILDRLQAANFNTVMLQTRLRGDVIYPSRIECQSAVLTGKEGGNPGYDPLQFIIEQCHKRQMECHAWIVTMPLGNQSHVKMQGKASVANRHPDMCKKHQNEYYLDPGNPETAPYILSIVKEIVENYDVDGIHLDYIRYPEKAASFPDQDTFKKYAPKGMNLQEWRRENISRIVYTLYNWIKLHKPHVKLSSAPLGRYTNMPEAPAPGWNAYETVYQDVKTWIEQEKHDFIIPMMYAQGKYFDPYLYQWKKIARNCPVIPGLGAYQLESEEGDWPLETLLQQIDLSRLANVDGQGFYRVENLFNRRKQLWESLCHHYYAYPALPPLMNGRDSVPPQPPVDLTLDFCENNTWKCTWRHADSLESDKLTFALYAFPAHVTDTNDPQYLVAANIREHSFTLLPENLPEGSEYIAVSAIDKAYNESVPSPLVSLYNDTYSGEKIPLRKGKEPGFYTIESLKGIDKIAVFNLCNKLVAKQTYENKPFKFDTIQPGTYKVVLADKKGRLHTFIWNKD